MKKSRTPMGQPGIAERAEDLLNESLLPKPDSRTIQAYAQLYEIYYKYKKDYGGGIKHLKKQLSFYEEHNDQTGKVSTLSYFRDAYAILGNWKNAYQVTDQAKKILRFLNIDGQVLLNRLEWSPWFYVWSGRYTEAESKIRKALEFYQNKGEVHTSLVFLCDLSLALGVQGKYEGSLNSFNYLNKRHESLKNKYPYDISVMLDYRGYISTLQGNLELAESDLTESLKMKQDNKDEIGMPEVYNWLGELNEAKASRLKGEEKIKVLKIAESNYDDSLKWNRNFRYYFECGAYTGLVRVNYSLGNYHDVKTYLDEAEKLLRKYEYNDYMASLKLCQGHMALLPDQESIDDALNYYRESLIHALHYNRFLLDEILGGCSPRKIPLLQPIIPACRERGKEGEQMLAELLSWWKQRNIKAEQDARNREMGDGSPQQFVVEQIEEFLYPCVDESD